MIFIPFNTPSSKNSKQLGKTRPRYICPACKQGVGQRPLVLCSKPVKNYLKKLGIRKYGKNGVDEYMTRENLFRQSVGDYFKDCPVPVIVKFHFVRDSKRKFDFHNAVQIIADLLVAHRFIEDDDMNCFLPVPMMIEGKWYSVDKNLPGVFVQLHGEE
jgi:hypothetical protein